jgi:hypothetical protein
VPSKLVPLKLIVHELIINQLTTNFPTPFDLKPVIFFKKIEHYCSLEINLLIESIIFQQVSEHFLSSGFPIFSKDFLVFKLTFLSILHFYLFWI